MMRDLLQGRVELCADQRGADRHVLRLAATIDAGAEHPISVHNLSRTGLLVASHIALAKGEEILVELAGGGRHRAEVVWADDGLFGCRFIQPLSRASLSAALLRAEPAAPAARSPELVLPLGVPEPRESGALTLRAKASIIGSAALACWACLAGAVYVLA